MWIFKKQKSNKKFATRVQKKKSKEASKTSATLFTIAPSKDQKIWFVKKNGKMIGKCKSKIEAVDKAKAESDKNFEIKVYNQAGRLIDSIK